ncbi:MAG: hypothetical protein MUC49_01540 [Raineya sp.]|jgi:hypothetical protein|nr:hypothetical protein [Raineya sp.]
MQYYFSLQYRILNRHIRDLALHPLIIYLLGGGAFLVISNSIFKQTHYAPFVYLALALSSTIGLQESHRNMFLKWCYPTKVYQKIRITENLIVVSPFLMFLFYKIEWLFAGVLVILAILFSFIQPKKRENITIPTPFYKYPYEFMVGFRNAFYLFFVAYGLLLTGILSKNANLAVFAIIIVFLVSLAFYMNTEDKFYVWTYSISAKKFLFKKIGVAFFYTTCILLPVFISLIIFFPKEWWMIGIFMIWGYLLLLAAILMKYSVFPEKVMLKESFLFALNFQVPPLLLILIPYWYFQSLKKLDKILK